MKTLFTQLRPFPLNRSVVVKVTPRDGFFTSNTYVVCPVIVRGLSAIGDKINDVLSHITHFREQLGVSIHVISWRRVDLDQDGSES